MNIGFMQGRLSPIERGRLQSFPFHNWEKEFQIINPKKNQSGTRKFSAKDIEKFELIFSLVKERGFTLEGAKKELNREKNGNLSVLKKLQKIRQELLRIKAEL